MPKTFKELISIVLEVRTMVLMICRLECFIGGSYNTIIATVRGGVTYRGGCTGIMADQTRSDQHHAHFGSKLRNKKDSGVGCANTDP